MRIRAGWRTVVVSAPNGGGDVGFETAQTRLRGSDAAAAAAPHEIHRPKPAAPG
jgi:hypothetical protein